MKTTNIKFFRFDSKEIKKTKAFSVLKGEEGEEEGDHLLMDRTKMGPRIRANSYQGCPLPLGAGPTGGEGNRS